MHATFALFGLGNQELMILLLLLAAILVVPRLLHSNPRVRQRGVDILFDGALAVVLAAMFLKL